MNVMRETVQLVIVMVRAPAESNLLVPNVEQKPGTAMSLNSVLALRLIAPSMNLNLILLNVGLLRETVTSLNTVLVSQLPVPLTAINPLVPLVQMMAMYAQMISATDQVHVPIQIIPLPVMTAMPVPLTILAQIVFV